MKHKEKLEEEVEFWLSYIGNWKTSHDEPVPDRTQQLLDNALLKLETYGTGKNQVLSIKSNKHTVH